MNESIKMCKYFVEKASRETPLGKLRRKWQNNAKKRFLRKCVEAVTVLNWLRVNSNG
jgi:hypothetical protein